MGMGTYDGKNGRPAQARPEQGKSRPRSSSNPPRPSPGFSGTCMIITIPSKYYEGSSQPTCLLAWSG